MDFRDIEYFAVLADHRHVGRAADALGLSQPAMSLSLRRLEKSVQAKLVKRTPKGVELTAVGAALLSQVQRLRLVRKDIEREMLDLSQGQSGHLRVGASPGLTEHLAAVACTSLLRNAPKVTLKATVATMAPLLSATRNGELDLSITGMSEKPTEALSQVSLFDDEFVIYASADHRLAKRKNVMLADIANERWAYSDTAFGWKELSTELERRGLPQPRIAVDSNVTSLRYYAVANSDLVGFISKAFLRQVARQYRLAELRVKELSVTRRVGVTYRSDGYVSPTAKRFIEILKATAKEIASEKP